MRSVVTKTLRHARDERRRDQGKQDWQDAHSTLQLGQRNRDWGGRASAPGDQPRAPLV